MLVADSPDPTARAALPRIVAIIPARYQSSRFPGKALAAIDGRPMIEHVYRRAAAASSIADVIVATDDARIVRAVEGFGGRAQMTDVSHRSGTDRLAEVAQTLTCDVVVNVQGDEPLIEPAMIDEAIAPMLADPQISMSSLRRRIDDSEDAASPHIVKVVVDRDEFALYFSRAPIPSRHAADGTVPSVFKHIGLYVYRRPFLIHLAGLPQTPLERSEVLEQLRALEHGYRIKVVETAFDTIGVDTPSDLERVRRLITARGQESSPRTSDLDRATASRH